MGKTKYVEVNDYLAHIWDDAFNIVLAQMIHAAKNMGIDEEYLQGWARHAALSGDSWVFQHDSDRSAIDRSTMLAIVDAASDQVVAMGEVTPEIIADWSVGFRHRKVSGGSLRGNKPVGVQRLLQVIEWLIKAIREDPDLEDEILTTIGGPK